MKSPAKLATPVSLSALRKALAASHDDKLAAYFEHLFLAGKAPAGGGQRMAAARDRVPKDAKVSAKQLPHSSGCLPG